jgi:hypothetical protein
MNKFITVGVALVFSGGILTACATKPAPSTTTTTRTQTSTDKASGESSHSDVKETRTDMPDGTQEVKTTSTTKETTPQATHSPPAK